MKKIFTLLLILIAFSLNAQEKISYKSENKTIEFKISKKRCFVKFNNKDKTILQSQKISQISENTALLNLSDNNNSNFSILKSSLKLKFDNKLTTIEPVLIYEDGIEQVCNGEINIKIKSNSKIDKLLEGYSFTIKKDEFTENQFLVKIEDISTNDLFEFVNLLQNNKEVEFVEPNFMRFLKPHTSDPFYNSQWSINNQGYLGGTIDADMDVTEAWTLSTGNGIKVAIIDEGVDLNHPDLAANLLPGYDATGNNSYGAPNMNNNDAHGTSCAGIVAAVANNNIGISGIAYNSKIIPVRIAYSNGLPFSNNNRAWITSDSWIASGINWAVSNNADVLSNSWGGGSPSVAITNAINNAVTNGRNGKGCVVLFSTGNTNVAVSYPATLPNVIAVGASTMCDQRKTPTSCDGEYWWGSNYGTGTDVIAPGVQIYSTDISVSSGYTSGDYISDFNGTSSACPGVAGVVALMLSVNPNLTGIKAREYLETSTDKVTGYSYSANITGQPNGSWNNEVGYGRINANNAVFKVFNLSVNGNATICTSSNSNYTIQNYVSGLVTTWSCSSNLILSNPTNQSVNVTANGSGIGTITATFQNGQKVEKSVTVGVMSPGSITGTSAVCRSVAYNYYANVPGGHKAGYTYRWTMPNAYWQIFSQQDNMIYAGPSGPAGTNTAGQMIVEVNNGCGWSGIGGIIVYPNSSCPIGYSYIIYPNPNDNSNSLTVEKINTNTETNPVETNFKTNTITETEIFEVEIKDLTGNTRIPKKTIKNKSQLDISTLQKGVYLLLINNKGEVSQQKIIIN
jgi:subtilisin family serine protease